jgi:hypothetical protein
MADAVYCHFFCLKLHQLNVENWPAGFFWDEVRVKKLVLRSIVPFFFGGVARGHSRQNKVGIAQRGKARAQGPYT